MRKFPILLLLLSTFLSSCKLDLLEENEFLLPTTEIINVRNNEINETEVTFSVSDPSDNEISYMGICYNQRGNPEISENQSLFNGDKGTFVYTVPGLKPDSTYYIKSFAASELGYSSSNTYSFVVPKPTPIVAPCTVNEGTVEEDGAPYTTYSEFASESGDDYKVDLQYNSISGKQNLSISFNQKPITGIYTTSDLSSFSSNEKNAYVKLVNTAVIKSGKKLYVENINSDSLRISFCDLKYTLFSNEVNLAGHIKLKMN